MNGSIDVSLRPEEEPRPARAPTEFTGVIDERVISDLHHLFRRKARRREAMMFVIGLAGVGLGILGASDLSARHALSSLLRGIMTAFIGFSGWWTLRKGWARFMLDQVITGRIHGVGVVVDQLDDRASWDEFCSARLSDSAALLFIDEKELTPQVLKFDGLPLHRSFFESREDWDEVCQLIRERVRKVSIIARR